MARVVCPSPGCQVTLMDYSHGPHLPHYGPTWCEEEMRKHSLIIIDGPHRILSAGGGYCGWQEHYPSLTVLRTDGDQER